MCKVFLEEIIITSPAPYLLFKGINTIYLRGKATYTDITYLGSGDGRI